MRFFTLASPALLVAAVIATPAPKHSFTEITPLDDDFLVPGDNPLKHCKAPDDDILDLKKVDLNPNPPKAGNTLSITASGVLNKDIEEGADVKIQVKYGLITILRQTVDLCETVKNVDLECPLKKGELSLSKDVDLPKEIPPGKYTVVADVNTKDGDAITCLTATVEFHRGASVFDKLIKQEP